MDIKVLLWYDVEDYITPESDDALLALIEMMDTRGIKGTFKFVGEKIRVIKERGRTDILDKLSGHDVGYHTDNHSQHPTISEYCEPLGFKDGTLEFENREIRGLEDLKTITGKHIETYGQPGASWAPQVFPVLKKYSVPTYIDENNVISVDRKPFWYGGILCLTELEGIMRMNLKEGALDDAKKKFDCICSSLQAEKTGFVSIFYHPCEFSTTKFWDGVNFSRGHNTPRCQWRSSPLRPAGQMEYYINMLGQFLDYILSKNNVEFIKASQVVPNELSGDCAIKPGNVKSLAGQTVKQLYFTVNKHCSLSASDTYSLFCRYMNGEELKPELIYGPENEVITDYAGKVTVSEIKKAINIKYPKVYDYKQLPDYFMVGGKRISPVDMTCTLAEIIRGGLSDDDQLDVVRGCLKSTVHINENDEWGKGWTIFPEDFKASNIIRMARLQSWTLKPALF